ncbi:hypothetical protein ISU07_19590 [Nocardioides islandensis]|uniref:Glycerophosphoryl diester phosphodiesterase membrane domain-containing protein n=1 Tax=Nocardioides islandensis TaxID=433663 RepID=A0A930YFY8_9ACTN|nr:hypothetical protein [Nocardioides islandensis]MBF4765343.1 hypothetical protein [Nocardioides islandensis]
MSGSESYPPPGSAGHEPAPQPPPPPSGWQQQPPPPPAWSPYPAPASGPIGQPMGQLMGQPPMVAATLRPGAIPLRPLGLGDIYDAAFRIIRHNARATVGSAVLVTAVAMLIPVLITAAFAWTVDASLDPDANITDAGVIGALGTDAFGWLLQSVGLVLVTGMVAHVTMAAALGQKLTLTQAWEATKGKRLKLFGLMALLLVMMLLLIALFVVAWLAARVGLGSGGIVLAFLSFPVFVAVLWWFWIRVYYLPVPALMLEDVGIFGAIERGHALTRGAFWRVFGIALLTTIVTSVAGLMLTIPLGLVTGSLADAGMSPGAEAVWRSVANGIGSVVQSAFVAPFTAVVTAVQYVDQRIRKEAFDVELMTRSGITGR